MSATMTWNVPTLASGQQTSRNLIVTVTDADGVVAQRLKPVTLSRTADDTDTGVDSVCKQKPWSPQC